MDRWLESCEIMSLKKDISGGEPTHMASVCLLLSSGGPQPGEKAVSTRPSWRQPAPPAGP